jgi:hypothetical protein
VFGYVKPFKPELRLKEFDTYKAAYCGLCHEMGRHYGPLVRFSLSYDFTFAALLGLALQPEFPGYSNARCMAHPFKKRPRVNPCGALEMVSGCAMSMLHQKALDNVADSKAAKRLACRMLLPFTRRMDQKAAGRFPEISRALAEMTARQQAVEQQPDAGIDAAAEPAAAAMGVIFAQLSGSDSEKRVLSRMGYLLGRWVYLIDALDDLADDAKKGGFNPFLRRFKLEGRELSDEGERRQVLEYGKGMLNATVGEMAAAYELLSLYRFKPILDNIIYLGLPASMEQVLAGKNSKKCLPSA